MPIERSLERAIGGTVAAAGLWRFFSTSYPVGGAVGWNSADWRREWQSLTGDFQAFGEDVFGNQLVLRPREENAFLWHHEDGQFHDLLLDPVLLIESVESGGVEWVDFYQNGCLDVARPRLESLSPDDHLHWVTPLILGGQIETGNLEAIDRMQHLGGHAELWRKIGHLPLGTHIVFKP
jgi:hypothetical protein